MKTILKRLGIVLSVLSVACCVVLALHSCNKEKDGTQEETQQDDGMCLECLNDNKREITDMHKLALNQYFSDSKSLFNTDSLELIGVVRLNDETVDWSMLYGKRVNSSNVYYTYYYDETKQIILGEGKFYYHCENGIATVTCEINNSLLFMCTYNENTLMLHSSISGVMTEPTMGDNVMDCYRIAKSACMQDPDCSTMCDFITWSICDSMFWISCASHHVKASIIEIFF